MSEFVKREIDNFWNLKWLNTYMMGHKGFIAGDCFKNIFTDDEVKDIDIFFENEADYLEAKEYYDENDEFHFYYQNDKVVSYKHKDNDIRIELINSVFGKPEDIIGQFDFSIVKFAYYKEVDYEEEEVSYKIMHHKDFFEHLHLKRLVIGNELRFPNGTFERMLRYLKYGYFPCKESKVNLIRCIRENENQDDTLMESLYDGLD
ncbi:hypothetical protein [Brevibacillus porteri]|uniref:hypothetical protein n=1 Tax=Brevibacillus porteri TaxID=2126350 RepID=UPI003624D206